MSPGLRLMLRIALNAVALLILPEVIDGLRVESYVAALAGAILIAVVNALLRPLLILVTLPITLLSLGLFTLVINALLFWMVTGLVGGVAVDGFWTAFWSALLYSVLTWLVSLALGDDSETSARIHIHRR